MSARRTHRVGALCALAVLLLAGCGGGVEPGVFIIVRSNITNLGRVRLRLTRDGRPTNGGTTYFDTVLPVRRAAPDVVGSIAVRSPTDRPDVPLYVIATALVGDREIVTQQALVTFDVRRQQRLTMFLAAECESVQCSSGETCTRGPVCVTETIERLPDARSDAGAVEPLLPSPTIRPDASAMDAAMDASETDVATDSPTDVRLDVLSPRGLGVVVGGTHTCATRDGATYCWGSRSHGQIASSQIANDTIGPQRLSLSVFRLALGARHTCAVAYGFETPFCWGDAAFGALGRPGQPGGSIPAQVAAPTTGIVDLWSAGSMTCAASVGPSFRCWGDNRFGQLGFAGRASLDLPTLTFSTSPAPIQIPVYLGSQTVCFRHGRAPFLSCVGLNDRGQFGALAPAESSDLVAVRGASVFFALASAGGGHGCAIPTPIGSAPMQCWGDNASLQCGRAASDAGASVDLGPIDDRRSDWTSVHSGRTATCATDMASNVYCWGSNEAGQLGTGSLAPTRAAIPQRVALPEAVLSVDVSPDGDVACAVTRSLELYCWGDNRWGQMGYPPAAVGSAEPTPTPTRIDL